MSKRVLLTVVCLVLLLSVGRVKAAEFVWIEGEAGKANVKVNTAGWGRPEFLSQGQWLSINVPAEKVDAEVPEGGIIIDYQFKAPKTAKYEIWNRVGFEFTRSPFDWRIDNGAWQTASNEELTTDLMELARWCEVAWLKLGEQDLKAGDHQLQIRLTKIEDDGGKKGKKKGEWKRINFTSDAICIHEGPFHPNSKFKPGESGRDAADEAAAKVVFKLPDAKPAERSTVSLAGQWEVARDDEQLPGEVAKPIKELPQHPFWRAIPVPSDKNKARADLIFAHRLWYRTQISVPQSLAGRAFTIEFPYNNLNTTVYVNGVYCGFEKNPFCRFQLDVTRAIKPGQVNEVLVGIRDAWYGRSADPDRPLKLRKTFNYPLELFRQGFQQMDYPVWNCAQSGILCTPTFTAAGSAVYTSDVFVKPSVAKKELEAEVTLTNSGGDVASGEIQWEAVDDQTGEVEKRFAPMAFELPPGKSQVINLAGTWANPRLWWPDTPNLYRLRTRLVVGGRAGDSQDTLFGFREWRREGTQFTLNGVVWRMWADLVGEKSSPQQWLAAYKATNQRLMRMSTGGQGGNNARWLGLEPQAALEFCDRNGVVVRRNCTVDGETIGYAFAENDKETIEKQGGSKMKTALMKNWLDQCVAQVKGERNHPSVQIWSIENEFAYVNLVNLLGHQPLMDDYEEAITRTHDAVLAADPTRSVMTDGGSAMKNNTLKVAGDHYVATLDERYPDLAYEPFVEGGGRGRWQWDMKRPRYIGEEFFATGINPADYARWGGEVTFQGKAATRDAVAFVYRMLTEGYRWGGYYAAWHLWLGSEGGPAQWVANAPRAVFVRQYDWTFGAGQPVTRTFGVFNDSQYTDPLVFTRRLVVSGKEVYAKTTTHNVAPGTSDKFDEVITMPAATTRQEGELLLTLSAGGKELFHDVKKVSVLPPATVGRLAAGTVAVFDPKGEAAAFLGRIGVSAEKLASLDKLPEGAKVLVVGRDAISLAESTSTRLAAYAAAGRAVIVLNQTNPLKYHAVPAEMPLAVPTKSKHDPDDGSKLVEGSTAFIEDASHPALRGLVDKDFFTWGPDHHVYRNAYVKPTRGGKSLVQTGPRLVNSALVEVPVGKGALYLSQLEIGGKLATNAVAQHLLANLVRAGAAYKLEHANVAAVVDDPNLAQAIDSLGLRYAKAADPLAALADADKKIAIVTATPSHLKALAANLDKLQAFWQRGGTIMLCGLTPAGLADYNQIVGVDHVIRPFTRERVAFPAVRNPLTAGLTTGDVVMLSGERIFRFNHDEYTVNDEFSYIVDLDDMAPFGKSDFASYKNIVNGFVSSDGWPLIIDFPAPEDGKPFDINIDLPREETIVEYTHDPSVHYSFTTRIALLFDGKDRVEYALMPNGDPQTFAVDPPRKAKHVTLQIVNWETIEGKKSNIGIDNIYLKVQRSPQWQATVRPMLNIGGLVQYAKGNGSVVLCNLKFQANEAVPANQLKKRAILAAVLRNLKAPLAGGKSVIAGVNLVCDPIDIHTKATTYKDERGWFGAKLPTLKDLPAGEHVFAGIRYNVYEMPTSPVPQVLMLGGKGVPGKLPDEITDIPVNAKADALFFLHTARIDRQMNDRDRAQKKEYELCKYVIKYADGKTAELPIVAEVDIDDYRQDEPRGLPGAQLAWTRKLEGSDQSAAVFAKQWTNPRPDVSIKSIDMVYGKDKTRGVPALIAVTAAQTQN